MFEPLAASARAQIVPAELFHEFFVAMDDPDSDLNLLFGRESSTAFAH
jgi:hypothetical protein